MNIIFSTLIFAIALFLSPTGVSADHSWGSYHWGRTSNPFSLKLGDNLNTNWDPYLVTASSKWSLSSVMDTTIVPGHTTAKRCRPTSGMVEVCNDRYGNNGWLGIAQVLVSSSHITQGTVKMNDTYYNTAKYNTPAWKNLVVCQEVGHTFGLDHQDENFDNANLGTCMDYTNNPLDNQFPNAHDYEQLETIYAHLDTFNTLSQNAVISNRELHDKSDWGRQVKDNGKNALYEKDFGNGLKVFTFVTWAE